MKTRRNKEYSFFHTKQRAEERYGIKLTPEIYEIWNALCTDSNRSQTDFQGGEVVQTVHNVVWGKRKLTLVVKHKDKDTYIATALPWKGTLKYGR